MSSEYWAERQATAQANLMEKGVAQTEVQLKKYYQRTMNKVIGQFEATYNKVLSRIEEGKAPTPADLYKLDSYWKMQGQLKQELLKLGDKQAALLSKQFINQFIDAYEDLAIQGEVAYNTISKEVAEQMINQVWCADGKSWSSRIWNNIDKLQQTLNDGLIECLVAGKKTTDLKNILQERFSVSYSAADSVVRTEMAHIQTQAAQKRYTDYGIQYVQIWADKDERRCDVCGKLHKTKYPTGAAVPIPAHPRCRCCIIPVVEDREEKTYTNICEDCGKSFETYNEATKICSVCKHNRWKKYNRVDKKNK